MPVTPHPLRILFALGAASLATTACVSESDPPGADTGTGSSDPDDTASATTSSASLPDACSIDESPFLQPACLDALRLACNAHAAENDCAAEAPLAFDDGGFLGSWSAVDAEPGSVVSTCASNVEPPSDPLCDCATAACDAR